VGEMPTAATASARRLASASRSRTRCPSSRRLPSRVPRSATSSDASRSSCANEVRGFPEDSAESQSRLLMADVAGTRIVNVYIPNGQSVGSDKYQFKLQWMKRLRELLDQSCDPKSEVLICGDFNVAPEERDVHDPRLWQNRILFSEAERAALQHIKEWGFTDTFRLHTEEGGHYSWWDYRAGGFRRNLGLRIDHVWVSTPMVTRNRKCWIDKETRAWERPSDHAPVVAEFESETGEAG